MTNLPYCCYSEQNEESIMAKISRRFAPQNDSASHQSLIRYEAIQL